MKSRYNPEIHHRRCLRLKDYDYAQAGAYFVTICTQGKLCLFGEILEQEMHLNAAGERVEQVWSALPQRYPMVELDAWVIMPNHLHGVLVLNAHLPAEAGRSPHEETASIDRVSDETPTKRTPTRGVPTVEGGSDHDSVGTFTTDVQNDSVGTPLVGVQASGSAPTLGTVMGAFKGISTNVYIQGVREEGWMPFPGKLWQANYYEHILRDENELERARSYILYNPARWQKDRENPINIPL